MINMERRGKGNAINGENIPTIPEKALFEAMSSLKKQNRLHFEVSSQIAATENTFTEKLGRGYIYQSKSKIMNL